MYGWLRITATHQSAAKECALECHQAQDTAPYTDRAATAIFIAERQTDRGLSKTHCSCPFVDYQSFLCSVGADGGLAGSFPCSTQQMPVFVSTEPGGADSTWMIYSKLVEEESVSERILLQALIILLIGGNDLGILSRRTLFEILLVEIA
ncbi:hypothetical protein NDU88_009750 [Pleurodeles waltl]|uniref:Uncharacterized protein n=1 Tax=Pleurodeles waltl TaxID=8319 RepID=A0AAV7QVY8_PLEWA|nr:hypothetical protein NDU88_009750 [Pleurodeles waltl]